MNKTDVYPGEEILDTDDLVFIIGEREIDLYRKRKGIKKLVENSTKIITHNTALKAEIDKLNTEIGIEKNNNKKEDEELQNFKTLEKELKETIATLQKEKESVILDLNKKHEDSITQFKEKLNKQRETIDNLTKRLESLTSVNTELKKENEEIKERADIDPTLIDDKFEDVVNDESYSNQTR